MKGALVPVRSGMKGALVPVRSSKRDGRSCR
jgi:hypothetical protein